MKVSELGSMLVDGVEGNGMENWILGYGIWEMGSGKE